MESRSVLAEHPALAAELRAYAGSVNTVEAVAAQQALRARNARLFTAYDAAVGNEQGEMWTGNPPEGRLAPEP